MIRVHGLLSWFDEPVTDLVACIKSLHDAGVDSLVAVDGRYRLYPGERAVSHPNEHAAIALACRQLGMDCTIRAPAAAWDGNEVEKRTALFALAWAVAAPGDWFWVMDADQVVVNVPDDFKDRLAATAHDCAEVEFLDTVAQRVNRPDWPARFTVRDLFRAQPIRVVTNHITYVAEDGRLLWGYEDGRGPLEKALDLTGTVLVEHRPDRRPQDRLLGKLQYYAERDATRVERGTCQRCGAPAVRLVPTRWRMTHLGPVADWMEACDVCGPRAEKANRMRLLQMGVDPDTVTAENRNGHAPQGMTTR